MYCPESDTVLFFADKWSQIKLFLDIFHPNQLAKHRKNITAYWSVFVNLFF